MRRALIGLVSAALLPAAASAQTRGWELCFTSGVRSCTQLALTTTPVLVGGVRTGTLFDVALRYVERDAWRSALQSVALAFAPDPADVAAVAPAALVALAPVGGAAAGGATWAQQASSSPTDPTASLLVLTSHAALLALPGGAPQLVGGCGVAADGGAIDAATATSLWTCAPGAAYRATFEAAATLDADRVTAISVDAYRAYPGVGAPLAPFCTARTDGSGSVGTAEGDFSDFGDVCAVRPLAATAVPEPATLLLLAGGLLLLPAARRLHHASERTS